MKKLFFLLTILFITSPSFAQEEERKPLKGKIKSQTEDLEGIYIINKNTEASVVTQQGGYFTIMAKPEDTLIFSAIQVNDKQVVVEKEHISENLFFVELEPAINMLNEVVIENYGHITAESLGIVPKGQKRYTPAERKLFTASNGLDGLINSINGKKKALKKGIEYEKKEMLMAKINYIYEVEDIVKEFKIPEDYVGGFIYYIVEDEQFAAAVKSKNNTMAKFLMSRLSVKYRDILKEDSIIDKDGNLIEAAGQRQDSTQVNKPETHIKNEN